MNPLSACLCTGAATSSLFPAGEGWAERCHLKHLVFGKLGACLWRLSCHPLKLLVWRQFITFPRLQFAFLSRIISLQVRNPSRVALAGFLCRRRKMNYVHSDVFLKCLLCLPWFHGNVMRVSRRRIKISLITSLKNANWKWNLSLRRNQQCHRRHISLVLVCVFESFHVRCTDPEPMFSKNSGHLLFVSCSISSSGRD